MKKQTLLTSATLLCAMVMASPPAMAQSTNVDCVQTATNNCPQDAQPELGPGSQQNAPDENEINTDMSTGAGSQGSNNAEGDEAEGGILDLGPGSQQNAPDVDDHNDSTNSTAN